MKTYTTVILAALAGAGIGGLAVQGLHAQTKLPTAFSLMMLGSTPAGDAYTFAELDQMFRNTGFKGSEAHKLPGPQTVIVSAA